MRCRPGRTARESSTNTTNRQTKKSPSAADALTFNISGLLAEPAGSVRDYVVFGPALNLGPDLRQSEGLEGSVRLTRTNRGVLVRARLATALEQQCSRCLQEIEWPVEIKIDEEALPIIDFESGVPLDVDEEPDVLRLNDHHELELESEIREAIQLAEPIAPLCRKDCPGLCIVCGQELASGPHDHPDEDVDPRLEALRGFADGGGGA
jgi:uncharacterized protein